MERDVITLGFILHQCTHCTGNIQVVTKKLVNDKEDVKAYAVQCPLCCTATILPEHSEVFLYPIVIEPEKQG